MPVFRPFRVAALVPPYVPRKQIVTTSAPPAATVANRTTMNALGTRAGSRQLRGRD